jgi:hypothetical protein
MIVLQLINIKEPITKSICSFPKGNGGVVILNRAWRRGAGAWQCYETLPGQGKSQERKTGQDDPYWLYLLTQLTKK